MSAVQPTDKTLVNRAGVDHSAPADMSTVQDTDLLLINRAGVDYKCTFLDWKNSQSKAPDVGAVTLADVAGGSRFTSVSFPVSATMTEDGIPASTKKLKAYVEGTLKSAAQTSGIASVAGNVLTLTDNTQLANFTAGDAITEVTSTGTAGDATGTVGAVDAVAKTITLATTAGTWDVGSSVKGPLKTQMVTVTPNSDVITAVTSFSDTWVKHTAPVALHSGIWCEGLGLFVARYQWSSTPSKWTLATSPDGINWTQRILPGSSAPAQLAWSEDLGLILMVQGDGTVFRSSDGLNWTQSTTLPGGKAGVTAWSPLLKIFTVLRDDTSCFTSADGITFQQHTHALVNGERKSLLWSPEDRIFVGTGYTGSPLYWSADGIAWTDTGVGSEMMNIAYSPELRRYVAVTSAGADTAWSSTDGKTWAKYSGTVNNNWNGVAYGNEAGVFVMVGGSDSDPASWASTIDGKTPRTSGLMPPDGTGIVYGGRPNRVFVAFTATTDLYVSRTVGETQNVLTFSTNKDLSSFKEGDAIKQSDNGATGSVIGTKPASNTMSLIELTGTWGPANTGKYVIGPTKTGPAANVKLYCKLDAAGAVSDLQSADPGFTAWTATGAGPYTGSVTFPATLPSGAAPDTDLPAGTTITVEVQATNTAGTDSAKSNVLTPA